MTHYVPNSRPVRSALAIALAGVVAGSLTACSGIELDDIGSDAPEFDFEAFFEGHTRASGWFSDRGGVPQRHFCGDFEGTYDGDEFVLDERLFYTDGVVEDRVWRVQIDDTGAFTARSDTLVTRITMVVKAARLEPANSALNRCVTARLNRRKAVRP